jgi:hypothetical protein
MELSSIIVTVFQYRKKLLHPTSLGAGRGHAAVLERPSAKEVVPLVSEP